MGEFFSLVSTLVPAIAIGYLLGALPVAYQISRRHGVDIFSVGTGLSGASNVRRNVGNVPGALVLIGDIAKGALSVIVARMLGVEGMLLVVPGAAAIAGHWRSVFTRFRGGDGLATLGGIVIALFFAYGLIAIVAAMLVSLGGQKMPYTSLLSIVFGYVVLVVLSINYYGDMFLTLAAGGLAAVVLAYASLGHLKRRHAGMEWDDVDDAEGATEQTGF